MVVIRWFTDIVKGFLTVLVGMKVTMRHFLERPVTMHYPDEKWAMPDRFRGLIKVDMKACIVCDLCRKACPVDCILIEWERQEGKSGKVATRFEINYQKCLYCGLCAPPCPTDAIWHSHDYEDASYTRDPQVIDWVLPEYLVINPNAKPMKKKAPPKKKPAPAAAADAAPAATAVAGAHAHRTELTQTGAPA